MVPVLPPGEATPTDEDEEQGAAQGVEIDGFEAWPTKQDILSPPEEEETGSTGEGAPASSAEESGVANILDDGEEV